MKANNGKSHLLALCREPSTMSIDGWFIESNIREVLLGLTIDRNLRFDDALSRLAFFMNVKKRRIIMKAFLESRF